MKRYEEITGIFDGERHVFQDENPEERTIIATLADGTTIKGKAKDKELQRGGTYRFYGYFATHHRYGPQFVFETFTRAKPAGERGVVFYLSKAKGIGPRRARAIWDAYGPDSLRMVREEPSRVAAEITGLTLPTVEAAAVQFRADEAIEAVTIEVTNLLAARRFPKKLIKLAIETWGNTAPEVIRENPYALMVFKGVGFLMADGLYCELGLDPAAVERQMWCVQHSLVSESDGSTWFPVIHAQRAIERQIGGAAPAVDAAIAMGVERGVLADRVFLKPEQPPRWVAESRLAAAEQTVANCIHQCESEGAGRAAWPSVGALGGLSEHQRGVVSQALRGSLCILAGSPGTGKTYSLAKIIRAVGEGRSVVCAPTGKAAVRVTESLAREGVGLRAKTIHSTLGVLSADDGWRFDHTAANPLEEPCIFVDEARMIDTPLAASLLSARAAGAKILLVGDPDQLSPVGPGAPLRDLIAAGTPMGHLKEIRRNAGRIVRACAEIRDTQRFTWSARADLDREDPENLIVLERAQPAGQIDELQKMLARIAGGRRWGPVSDCQVLCAVNEKSPLARKTLNRQMQEWLNPDGRRIAGNPFRVHDKIICLKNGLLPSEGNRQDGHVDANGRIYVANGEQARVKEVQPRYTVARLSAPDRLVRIPRGESRDDGDTGCSWDLGYAISGHKSQGSEFPVVVVMLDAYPGAMRVCDRHWIYTAISRASELCVLIGKPETALAMCRRSQMWDRKTLLVEDILSLRSAGLERDWSEAIREMEAV